MTYFVEVDFSTIWSRCLIKKTASEVESEIMNLYQHKSKIDDIHIPDPLTIETGWPMLGGEWKTLQRINDPNHKLWLVISRTSEIPGRETRGQKEINLRFTLEDTQILLYFRK